MKVFALLAFVAGLIAIGRFNNRHARRMARHLMSLYRG